MIGVDTNVFINIIKPNDPPAQKSGAIKFFKFIKRKEIKLAISAITVTELFNKPFNHKSNEEIQKIDNMLHYLEAEVIPIERDSAVEAAKLIGELNVNFADALIAASLRFAGVKTLITRNLSDFKNCGLEVLTPEKFMLVK